jgi:hypothetical protein
MVSDEARRDLYDALERRLGQGPAGTLMELLPPVGWVDVARTSDLVAVRGEMAQLRGEMAELRGEMGVLRGEMSEIRGEIAKLGARIDGQIPRFIWANVPIVASVAGLVLAAAKLA